MADLRHDFRAEELQFKRDRDAVHKWKNGSMLIRNSDSKHRPVKMWQRSAHYTRNPCRNHTKPGPSYMYHCTATARISNALDAKLECAATSSTTSFHTARGTGSSEDYTVDPATYSALDVDNVNEGLVGARDAGVLYSYDEDASPASSLGLESLVDAAEGRFREKEVEKLVKTEYEVLDGEGEEVKKGKRGKKTVAVAVPVVPEVVVDDVDGDWEAI